MSKHTPGPWAVEVDKHGEVTVYEAVTLQNIDICKMGGNTNDGSNARLIHAAPDLLEVLKAFSEYAHAKECETDGPVNYSHGEITGLAYAARAAIAKARGPQ